MSPAKHVVFDVEGTLVGYEKFYAAIDDRLGKKLRECGVSSEVFGYLWIEVSEREYTYLSMSGGYTPYDKCIKHLFWRVLWKVGVPNPRDFASAEDLEFILHGFSDMEMKPGARECIDILRRNGFTVWAFTMADYSRIYSYFHKAGIDLPEENMMSCDSTSIGKPASAAYAPLLKRLSAHGEKPWFAAAHAWDVSAAKRQGFRAAYCTVFEHEPVTEIFGEMDCIADSLPEMAQGIVASSETLH